MRKVFTVAVVQVDGRVLLGFKKTKIGQGYWNGFGGRVEDGESVEDAARRELKEESGLTANKLAERGVVEARFRDNSDVFELRIFLVTAVDGEPRETREMKPGWFAIDKVPYDQMWASDRQWWPLLLAGKRFAGEIMFDNLENRQLLSCEIKERIHV